MAFKRKRSDSASTLSTSPSSSSSLPSLASSPVNLSTGGPALTFHAPVPTNDSGRTLKRWRDNRPSEALIHSQTISRLFAAQKHPSTLAPALAAATNDQAVTLDDAPLRIASPAIQQYIEPQPAQQPSLHAFWQLPGIPRAPASAPAQRPRAFAFSAEAFDRTEFTRCEDCDAPLRDGDGDVAMDMDDDGDAIEGEGDGKCVGCGKRVCDGCAVRDGQRTCLDCALR